MSDTTDPTTMTFRDRLRGNNLFVEALKQADLRPLQRLQLRGAYMLPNMRDSIDDFIEAKLAENGDVNAMANGDIIKHIIEHLPEIAAFIATLFKLFGGL
jgi:hypothetical protein